jgi:hypothetical protein
MKKITSSETLNKGVLEVYKKKASFFPVEKRVGVIKDKFSGSEEVIITTMYLFGIIPIFRQMNIVTLQ